MYDYKWTKVMHKIIVSGCALFALSTPIFAEVLSNSAYKEVVRHIKELNGEESCYWSLVEGDAYRELTVAYPLDDNLSLIGFLCDHGAYMPHMIWLFRSETPDVNYEQIQFAAPVIEEGADQISGVVTTEMLGQSYYDAATKQLINSRWYAAGDISQTSVYTLDYRPDWSVKRFLLKSFSADTKRNTQSTNVVISFNE